MCVIYDNIFLGFLDPILFNFFYKVWLVSCLTKDKEPE
jgi:hypothetical protein